MKAQNIRDFACGELSIEQATAQDHWKNIGQFAVLTVMHQLRLVFEVPEQQFVGRRRRPPPAMVVERYLGLGAIASRDDIKRVVNLQLKIRYVLELLGGTRRSA